MVKNAMIIKKIKKYSNYIHSILIKKIYEKNFISDDIKIKYILNANKDSKDLLVVFSACTRKGIPARYNYMRTLKNVYCNKLFILDDFGYHKRGGGII